MSQNLLESCRNCYKVTLPECPETIVLVAGLFANRSYYCRFTDKMGNRYTIASGTEAQGKLLITDLSLIQPLLTAAGGPLLLELFATDTTCAPTTLRFCTTDYTCVLLEFVATSGSVNSTQLVQCCE